MLFTSFIFESIDNREQVDAVYTDFQKAFDKVDHVLLLNKLAYNGIRGNLLRWFCSYISNRSQRVVVNGFASNSVRVTSGVPQGSILGPLLFVIFINDIKKCFLNTKFLLYADDLKIYKTIHSIADCNLFQDDLDRFSNYCITNKLHLSLSKCNTIIFTKNKNITRFTYTLCEAPLREVTTVRDLGVTLDSKFKLDQHIEQIVSKAFQMYGFVMRAAVDFKRPSTYLHLYKTIIRPQLEYAVPIWNPYFKKYINMIERVQRKFLRSVHFKFFKFSLSYPQLLEKYKILSLQSRRQLLEAMTLYGICHNKFDCNQLTNSLCYLVPRTVHRRAVRVRRLFAMRTNRTISGSRSPLYRLVETYNGTFVDVDIFALSPSCFKNHCTRVLISNQQCL